MTAHGRAMRHIECALPGFGKAGTGGRYDDGVSHLSLQGWNGLGGLNWLLDVSIRCFFGAFFDTVERRIAYL
jgi:hypothetical protein